MEFGELVDYEPEKRSDRLRLRQLRPTSHLLLAGDDTAYFNVT